MEKLDSMTIDDLWKVWCILHWAGNKKAKELFPNMVKGHRVEMKNIANYAANRATFLQCHESMYNDIAEKIYNKLANDGKNLVR